MRCARTAGENHPGRRVHQNAGGTPGDLHVQCEKRHPGASSIGAFMFRAKRNTRACLRFEPSCSVRKKDTRARLRLVPSCSVRKKHPGASSIGAFMIRAKNDTRARLRLVPSCSGRKQMPRCVFEWCVHVQGEKAHPGAFLEWCCHVLCPVWKTINNVCV